MGGRGSASGFGGAEGFSYTSRGKTMTVQRTSTGEVLVNGTKRSGMDYNKLKESAKTQPGYTTLSSSELSKMRNDRYENYKAKDYELLDNTRGKKKSVYRPRRQR